MAIQISPGVSVAEKDFTNIVPAVASSACAFAGVYSWGPVSEPTTIISENELVNQFGKPNDSTAQSFFTAANFLSYSANLLNIRVDTTGQLNATAVGAGIKVNNFTEYQADFETNVNTQVFAAKYPGALGNSIGISIADATSFKNYTLTGTVTTELVDNDLTGVGTLFTKQLYVGAVIKSALGVVVGTIATIVDDTNATFVSNALVGITADTISTDWIYAPLFTSAPATSDWAAGKGATTASDEMHIVITDTQGLWTGVPGTILEKYAFVSKAQGAQASAGINNYYKDVLNRSSAFVWWMTSVNTGWDIPLLASTVFPTLSSAKKYVLSNGADDFAMTDGQQQNAYALILNPEVYPLAYIAAGKASATVANFLISSIAEVRKDVIVFVSPQDVSTGSVIIGTGTPATTAVLAYRNALPSSSYSAMDTGYKYQYDRYNDKYRWVPLNGDIAGLCARTDVTNDPWYSSGGYNRGQIKNVVKLAFSPSQADRDALYPQGVNPVVSFPGQGVILYGDKTLLSKPSAFGSIGTRRLFIILEASISIAAKYQLFEFNDAFTQAQFKNMIEPFLANIQGRRGITASQVVCDSTNNTSQVVSSNNFVADIYIRPNYSISYIQLNFIAASQSVSFTTLGA
jgi:hypothetical protein